MNRLAKFLMSPWFPISVVFVGFWAYLAFIAHAMGWF